MPLLKPSVAVAACWRCRRALTATPCGLSPTSSSSATGRNRAAVSHWRIDSAPAALQSAAMLNGKKICVVMPAYNAAATLEQTLAEINRDVVDDIILVDDASRDGTAEAATKLGLKTLVHPSNRGYGGNQKTCYTEALAPGADIVVMLHPDYQYTPKLIPAMASMIASGSLRRRARLAHPRAGALRGRHAALQVRRQPLPHRRSRTSCRRRSSPSTTPATAPSRARCSRGCRSQRTPTTSSSTTRCSPRHLFGFRVGEIAARRATSPRRRPSTSAAASAMAWASSE